MIPDLLHARRGQAALLVAALAFGVLVYSDPLGRSGAQFEPPVLMVPDGASQFVPLLRSIRVLDTRAGGGPVEAGSITTVSMRNLLDVPSNAVAAVVTITVVGATTAGYVTAFAEGQPVPETSDVNVGRPGDAVANLATVPLSSDGAMALISSTPTDLLVDVSGVFTPTSSSSAGRFVPIPPIRVLDTRLGAGPTDGALTPGMSRTVAIAGQGEIPLSGVSAVAVTLTATGTAAAGFAQLTPTSNPAGFATSSNLNIARADQTVATMAILAVGFGGTITLYADAPAEYLIDVTGWFTDDSAARGTSGLYVPASPTRLYDSRTELPNGRAANTVLGIDIASLHDASVGSIAVVLNLTAIVSAGAGYLTGYPEGQALPETSSLNIDRARQTVAGALVVGTDANGGVVVFSSMRAGVIVDASGYFLGRAPLTPATESPTTESPTVPATTGAPTTDGASSTATTRAPTTTRPSTTTKSPTTTEPPTTTKAPTTTQPPTTTSPPSTTTPPGNAGGYDIAPTPTGRILHLAQSGSSGNGSAVSPFNSFWDVESVVQSGDTVYVHAGTWTDVSWYLANKNGTSASPITFMAAPGEAVTLRPPSTNDNSAILVENSSYVNFYGFTVLGWAGNPSSAGNGFEVDNSHHVRIWGNTVLDVGGGGLAANGSNQVWFDGNTVQSTSAYSIYQTSGISTYMSANIGGGGNADGYSIYIRGNYVTNVYTDTPTADGEVTDGNCIIIDRGRDSGYTGRTLVQNNICYYNGGQGLHTFINDNVDFVNNTVVHNVRHPDVLRNGGAEMSAVYASNVNFRNNLVIALQGPTDYTFAVANVVFQNNVFVDKYSLPLAYSNINMTSGQASLTSEWRLQANSQLINAGTWLSAPAIDRDGKLRTGNPDVGAYER